MTKLSPRIMRVTVCVDWSVSVCSDILTTNTTTTHPHHQHIMSLTPLPHILQFYIAAIHPVTDSGRTVSFCKFFMITFGGNPHLLAMKGHFLGINQHFFRESLHSEGVNHHFMT